MEHPAVPGGRLGGLSLALLRIELDRYACARRTAVPLVLTMSIEPLLGRGCPGCSPEGTWPTATAIAAAPR